MAQWTWVLTGNDYRPVGELLNVYSMNVAFPLSKLDTCSFTVRLDNPMADLLLSCRGYLKGYRNGTLMYFGPIISAQESVDRETGTVAVNSVGAGWILNNRFAGKSASGDISTTALDRAVRFSQLLATANAEKLTGITPAASSASSTAIYSTGPYKKLITCLQELSTGSDGFDWRIIPVDNISSGTVNPGSTIGNIVMQPVIGSLKENAVFEHGIETKHNIASYERIVSRESQANKVYHNASPGPDAPGYPTVSALDDSSIADWGLLEDLAEADLLDLTMRTQLVSAHVDVRKQPRQTINFTPISSLNPAMVPQLGTDFNIGDIVPARAVRNGVVRWSGLFRAYSAQFAFDNNGVEQMTIGLSADGE